jgi:hypothetical protein
VHVLEKLGLCFERYFSMNPGDAQVRLYGRMLAAPD